MDIDKMSTEEDLLSSIEQGLAQGFGTPTPDTMRDTKRDSLSEMTKSLPDWSLEPPDTFLA